MTTRHHVVSTALAFDGYHDNAGYDAPNRFSADLGRPTEASCDDFVTDVYRLAGVPLPLMQQGMAGLQMGSSYVPDVVAAARRRKATRNSWKVEPADLVTFHWPGGNPDGDHIELAVHWRNGVLRTIGMNSGPSNVPGNPWHGRGGVHLHDWPAPAGVGNSLILTCVDSSQLVKFGGKPIHKPARPPKHPDTPRDLMLKTPHLRGHDVRELQQALNSRLHRQLPIDGVFGRETARALRRFQRRHQDPLGVCGPDTRVELGL